MISKFYNILLIVGLVLFSTSCYHKDLCYDHTHTTKLTVVYDWSNAPEANPTGMCVFFYSLDNENEYYRFDFNNVTGGEIELPAGNYELITYNNDTELVRFSATNNFNAHLAYTRNGDLLEPMYGNGITSTTTTDNGERVVITPDNLWGCHATYITVNEHGETYTITRANDADIATDDNGNQIITLYPHDMLCHYSYEVRNVENVNHISKISASLSGMAPNMSLADESLGTETVTLPVPGSVDSKTNEIVGNFLTFGNSTSNSAPHKMTFYVVMDDGKKYVIKDASNLDVTTQVDNAKNPRRVHIIIDGLKLPEAAVEDEGFVPTVDDWGVVEEELKI